ncbi:UDP-2,4-diacetamido-2,4,6-trideoxy-beta-L-altropyranose hydrolase [Chitinilyticum piscinae]|uniref:UDP-2,4-diacetamido-2,4, 6-trideoxy-beta-L-altropyranose hydrolase n=1 Tax=Chitinilyticum piscinae TaxID=2866724 RepID=UPI0027E4145F|nr:UDP-2,4-diacetamido-2,4,6-trideoxy-beta-L-altropyranose hydrolase [Chitinilyticum piscinae]
MLIRADASAEIGSGHVMRCLTLADALRSNHYDVHFYCSKLPGNLIESIEAQGYKVFKGGGLVAGDQTSGFWDDECIVNPLMVDYEWLIADHYQLDVRFESKMRKKCRFVAVIDDLCNRVHAADIVVDQGIDADLSSYRALVSPACRLLLGPKFALLRREFSEFACQAPKHLAKKILVNFGGADPHGSTLQVLQALSGRAQFEPVVVAGWANPDWDKIHQICIAENWRAYRSVSNMAELMSGMDLAIGAVGGSTWERCAVGLPAICIAVAENQLGLARSLESHGVIELLGEAAQVTERKILDALEGLAPDLLRREKMVQRGRALVDGQGVRRVLDEMRRIEINGATDARMG